MCKISCHIQYLTKAGGVSNTLYLPCHRKGYPYHTVLSSNFQSWFKSGFLCSSQHFCGCYIFFTTVPFITRSCVTVEGCHGRLHWRYLLFYLFCFYFIYVVWDIYAQQSDLLILRDLQVAHESDFRVSWSWGWGIKIWPATHRENSPTRKLPHLSALPTTGPLRCIRQRGKARDPLYIY